MFFSARHRWLFVLLSGVLCMSPALAGAVVLQNATATYSQGSGGPFYVSNAIDANLGNGWAVLANPCVAAFETQSDIGYATRTELTFVLDHQYGGNHNLGRFRLSVTTDGRDDFADGKQAVDGADPGDVTADWTVLLPTSMVSSGGATITRPTDGTMVVTGTNPSKDTYTITALTNLTGITGVRLEVFKDASDPPTIGPGRAASNNFVLTNFTLAETQYTGPPQWNVDTDGNWSDAGNWVGEVPNAAGAAAEFRSAITASRTVTVDSPATVGTIHFDNANVYTIAGPQAVTLDGSAGTAAVNVAGGSHAIHAPLILNDPTAMQVAGGSTLSALGGIGGSGSLAKQGEGVLVVGQASYGGATVIEQGTLQLSNSVVPGSTVWFDAADANTLTLSGSNVTEWQSKGGTNKLVGVNTSTITYNASGAGLNDLAYVNTNGSNKNGTSYFDLQSDIADARTLFMVFKPTANPNAYTPLFGRNAGEGGNYMGTAGAGVGYVENTHSDAGLRTTGGTAGQWFLDGAAFDPVSEPLSLTDYRVVSVVAGADVLVQNIGRDRGFADRSLPADTGEILIYSQALTAAERQSVENYLLAKWLGLAQEGYAQGNLPASTAVQIGASGTFDLNGNDQTVASLADYGGAGGMVTNSHTAPAALTVGTTTGTTTFGGVIADGTGGMSLVKTGDSTQVLAGANTFTGGTTVEQGTLQLVGTNSSVGAIRGTVTVLPDGVLQLSGGHSLGHGLTTRVHTLNIDGGLVENLADLPEGWGISIHLTGGTLQSNGGVASASALSHFALGGSSGGTGSVIHSLASPDTSVICGRIQLREGNPDNRLAVHVADGAAAVDLNISAAITQYAAGYGITKLGDGALELTGPNAYTGGTTVGAGIATLRGAGRLGNGTYGGPIAIGENAVLNFNMTNSQNLSGPITGTGTLAQNATASYLYMTGDHSGFGGTFHNVAGNMYLASAAANSPAGADVRVDGGALQVGFNGAPGGTWAIGSLSGTGGVVHPNNNLAGLTVTLEVGGLNSDTTYGGILRNNTNATPSVLALTKVGTGKLTLAATNTYTGGTTVQDGILEVAATGALGSGPIAIEGGTVRLASNAYNALGIPQPAITIEPGGVLTADNATSNAHNLGLVALNGGTLTSVNGPGGAPNDGGYGNFILNSGLAAGGNAVSTVSSTTLSWKAGGGAFDVAENAELRISSRICDYPGASESLVKQGQGLLQLSGPNTYSGGTNVTAGTLLVSSASGSGTGTGQVHVNLDATLGGTGHIGGQVNINAGGSLAPGASVGALYLDGGGLTFHPNGFFDIDIDAIDIADLVQMDGGLLSPSDATIRVNLGFSPEVGDSWIILAGEADRNGIFNEDVLVTSGLELLDGWKRFEVGYGNSVILKVVPEPGTWLLLLASLVGGLMVRRRK